MYIYIDLGLTGRKLKYSILVFDLCIYFRKRNHIYSKNILKKRRKFYWSLKLYNYEKVDGFNGYVNCNGYER